MSEPNIAALVVLYNQSCEDSPTCHGLFAMGNRVSVLVYDNSTRDYGNKSVCQARNWTYLGGQGNAGLSKAYNACIDELKQQGFVGLVCLFDDDTQVMPEYFDVLEREASETDARIFVPIVESGGRILSPCLISARQKVSFFPDKDSARGYDGEELSAINSGMALRLSVFDHYRYDEAIFLDGIDHHFVQDMKCRGERIHVLHYRCSHDFSGDGRPSKAAALTRFRIFSKDYAYILREQKRTYWRLVGKRALHLTAAYRSPAFLLIFWRNRSKSSH